METIFSRLLGCDLIYKQDKGTGFISDCRHRVVFSTDRAQARIRTEKGPFPKGRLEADDLFQRLKVWLYAGI